MVDGRKSLYSVLGLAPDAPQAVIKAAYRALAKQYHPDGQGAGDPEAAAKFIELQQAYEVLSDEERRAKYDREFSQEHEEELPEEGRDTSINPDEVWAAEARLHPEIESIYETLNTYSTALGNRFRLAVITGECRDNPAAFAADIDRAFFRKYFGEDPEIQGIARKLLAAGNRRATKALNKAVQHGKFKDPTQSRQLRRVFQRLLNVKVSPRGDQSEPHSSQQRPAESNKERSANEWVSDKPTLPIYLLIVPLIVLGILWSASTLHVNEKVSDTSDHIKNAPKAITDRINPEAPLAEAPSSSETTLVREVVSGDAGEAQRKQSIELLESKTFIPTENLRDALIEQGIPSPAASKLVEELENQGLLTDLSKSTPFRLTVNRSPDDLSPRDVSSFELEFELNGYSYIVATADRASGFTPMISEYPTSDAEPATTTSPGEEDEEIAGQTKGRISERQNEKRLALVIGNANYTKIPWLIHPDDDAKSIADSLKSLGFEVITVTNASHTDMVLALENFSSKLNESIDVGLVYYSGHAIEVDSANYLLPINITPSSDAKSLSRRSVSLSSLIDVMNSAGVATKILILDACRNNPFDTNARGGLAEVRAQSGTFIAYATAPYAVANDGEQGIGNSPYTAALINALRRPDRPIEDMFRDVRAEVVRITDGRQVPWESSSLVEQFTFGVSDASDSSAIIRSSGEQINLSESTSQKDSEIRRFKAAADEECFARALYFDAKSGSEKDKLVVVKKIFDKIKNPDYPRSICGIVYRNSSNLNSCEFSFACDGMPDDVTDASQWERAKEFAKRQISGDAQITEILSGWVGGENVKAKKKIPLETAYTEDDEGLSEMSEDVAPGSRPSPIVVPPPPLPISGSDEQGNLAPKPRPKPIELIMAAAVNMKVEPSAAPTPVKIARHENAPLESVLESVIQSESKVTDKLSMTSELRSGDSKDQSRIINNVAYDDSSWIPQLTIDSSAAVRRDGQPAQFSEVPLSDLLPGVNDALPSQSKTTNARLSTTGMLMTQAPDLPEKGDLQLVDRETKGSMLSPPVTNVEAAN